MYKSDLIKELSENFIEYAAAVNEDRAIPDATSGLKPVARRIIYSAFDNGMISGKPHVKNARIVGNVMGALHPHGDSSIYGALVRLAQPWIMRYPLLDFHGNMGNVSGDGPAASRYTESRLSKIAEDGMLQGMKKKVVNWMSNYDESELEPVTLPALFPNLLCNPNAGIGVALACKWAPHNLGEVAQAIYDYMDGKEPTLPGPDFPTGGIIINRVDLPNIIKTGRGTVKIRGKYTVEDNKIIFTEIPYETTIEGILNSISDACEKQEITGITEVRDESGKKGLRIVICCDKNASINTIINKLFAKTDLQSSFSYNQVALVDKTPTELGLKDCIQIYLDHNVSCVQKEFSFDIEKAHARKEIVDGLLKALEDIDNIITLIKKSESSAKAKEQLIEKYQFTENQAKAIIDMKLGRLAGLERIELQNEKAELEDTIAKLATLLGNRDNIIKVIKERLEALVKKYGDARRTEITQIEIPKEEKEIAYVEPEKCVVVMTEAASLKRIPITSFKTQRRNGKGVKTQEDITSMIIRTNTIDSLMIFTNRGKMYRLLVNDIPVGNNTSKGTPISALIAMEPGEKATVIYSIYRDTDAKYVLFMTKNGLVKRTSLEEYTKTKKKNGISATTLREGDELVNVSLVSDEDLIVLTKKGMSIRFSLNEIAPTSRIASGIKGITLNEGDEVVTCLPIRHDTDDLAIFTKSGMGKRVKLKELTRQKRAGKGIIVLKDETLAAASLVEDEDLVLVCGDRNSICLKASELTSTGRTALGTQVIKNSNIISVSKV